MQLEQQVGQLHEPEERLGQLVELGDNTTHIQAEPALQDTLERVPGALPEALEVVTVPVATQRRTLPPYRRRSPTESE